jgi:FkbM family methyltransferase
MNYYLKLFRAYLLLKLKRHVPMQDIWRLDFFIFALKNKISIVSEDKKCFTVKYKLDQYYNFKIRHYPSSDFSVFKTVIIEKQYNIDLKIDRSSEITIIDGGANVGYTSIFYKDKYPNARIIAIEPFDENFQLLNENITINNLNSIHTEKKALWFKDTALFIDFNFRDSREHSIRTSEKKQSIGIHVDAISLLTLIEKYEIETIDILKLDIEGSEKDIFENDANINDILTISRNFVIEIHDEFNCRYQIVEILKSHFNQISNDGELTLGYNIENHV